MIRNRLTFVPDPPAPDERPPEGFVDAGRFLARVRPMPCLFNGRQVMLAHSEDRRTVQLMSALGAIELRREELRALHTLIGGFLANGEKKKEDGPGRNGSAQAR